MQTLPKIGEHWAGIYAEATGFVARIDGTVVTFVSLTGMRAPIQFDRRDIPWKFLKAAPTVTRQCSRSGCEEQAFIQYERPYKSLHEVVCPLHVPKGVVSTLLRVEDLTQLVAMVPSTVCRSCKREATEVLNVIEAGDPGTLWNCQDCRGWWMHHEYEASEAQGSKPKLFIPAGFEVMSRDFSLDGIKNTVTETITLKCDSRTKLTGPKPLNLYARLRLDL